MSAFCCFLGGSGEVVDFLRLNHLLNRRVCPFPREREEKVEARERRIVEGGRWWKVCILCSHPGGRLTSVQAFHKIRTDLNLLSGG